MFHLASRVGESVWIATVCIAAVCGSLAIGSAVAVASERSADGLISIGLARVDITPDYPVRLPGYASRTTESEGVLQRISAKALVIGGDDGDGPAVLLTIDNCGVPETITEEVAARLKEKAGIRRERLVICASHTHTAPWLEGFLPWHYIKPMPADHLERIRRYTRETTGRLVEVAIEAIDARVPSRLAWAQGSVGFSANRRVLKDGKWAGFGVNPDGPIDHSLPVLRVTDADGKLRAVLANYACHCTCMDANSIHGDWAGCAQEYFEADHPGVFAMIAIGCAADTNPHPRKTTELTEQHGRALADELDRMLPGEWTPLGGALTARLRYIELPFAAPPTRKAFEQLMTQGQAPGANSGARMRGYHAKGMLERIERDGQLPTTLRYGVATWAFDDDLALVFLPGEVVIDYVLRLKRELDAKRLWVTAYANASPCYIPSKRLLEEGGYEVDSSMISYGQPTRFAPAVEDRIIATVKELLPETFRASAEKE